MNKNFKIIILITTMIGAKLLGASTINCSGIESNCQIHINIGHKGVEEYVADLQIHIGKRKVYKYQCKDLSKSVIVWKNSEPPFADNNLIISSKRRSRFKPKFKIEIYGREGTLIIKNKEYKIKCEWTR